MSETVSLPLRRAAARSAAGERLVWPAALGLGVLGTAAAAAHVALGRTEVPFMVAALLLITLPLTCLLLVAPVEGRGRERWALALIMASALFVRYVYALTGPFLAGTDAPFHYFHTQEVVGGQWPSNNQISGAWPLLYLVYGALARVTGLSLPLITVWLHPLLNVATVALFYLYLRALVGVRPALVAAYIYAWEYTSFFFGFEFRTQSFAIFFFALFLALRAAGGPEASLRRQLLTAAAGTATLVAIGLTAAVSSILTTFLLAALIAGNLVARRLGARPASGIGLSAPLIVVTVMLCYLVYNTGALSTVAPYAGNLIRSTLSFELVNDANLKGVFVSGYGQFVLVLQWAMRLLFLAGMLIQLYSFVRRPAEGGALPGPLAATAMLLALTTAGTFLGASLSPGRYFQYLSPFYGLYAAVALGALVGRAGGGRRGLSVRLALAALLALWSISGVLKLPAELIDPRHATRSVPARLDRAAVELAGRVDAAFPAGRAAICADQTLAGAFYAAAGRAVERVRPEPEDAAACARAQAARHPERAVALVVDRSLSGDPLPALAGDGFVMREELGPIVVVARDGQ